MRGTPPSSERELFVGERTRLVMPVEKAKAFGSVAAPGRVAWIVEVDEPKGLADLEQLLDSRSGLPVSMRRRPRKAGTRRGGPGRPVAPPGSRPRPMTSAASFTSFLLQQRIRQEPDVVRPGDQHAVGDAEIDRLLQIRDCGAKISAMRLPVTAPHQHECDAEDVPAPAGLSDGLLEDGNRIAEQPRLWVACSLQYNAIEPLANRFPDASARRASSSARSRCSPSRHSPAIVASRISLPRLSVERVKVKLADRCLGDGIGLRMPPRRAEQPGQQPLVCPHLGSGRPRRGLARRPERASSIRSVNQSARPSSSATSPRRAGSARSFQACPQVVGCGRAVRPPLRSAELDKHLSPCCRVSLLAERAGEILDRGIGCALEDERWAAWRSVVITNESALGAIWRRWPAALGGAPASSRTSAAKRCALARSTTSSVS